MSSILQAERERVKHSAVADLLIGTHPDPSFIEFRENMRSQGQSQDSCPIAVLWTRLSGDADAMNQVIILMAAELAQINTESRKQGKRAVDLLVGAYFGKRISEPLSAFSGLEGVQAEKFGNILRPRYPKGTKGVLIGDYTANARGSGIIRETLGGRAKPIAIEGAIAVVAYDYPVVLRDFKSIDLPFKYLTTVSAIADSPLMERFPETQVKDLRAWNDRQKVLKA